jgi:hypothetical protein
LPPVLMTANIVFSVFRPAHYAGNPRGRLLGSGPKSRFVSNRGRMPGSSARRRGAPDAEKPKARPKAALERVSL